jgi:hypothetical protein
LENKETSYEKRRKIDRSTTEYLAILYGELFPVVGVVEELLSVIGMGEKQ